MLCESLTYERGPPAILNGNAVPGRPWTTVYSPPFDEFEVEHVSIPEKARFEGIQTYLPENQVRLYCCHAPSQRAHADTWREVMMQYTRSCLIDFSQA